MEKPIKFVAKVDHVRSHFFDGSPKLVLSHDLHGKWWLDSCQIPGFKKGEEVVVTLSPACPVSDGACPEQEPDYKAMWETAKEYYEGKRHVWSATDRVADKLLEIEAKHTPQGVKKEET